MQNRFPSNRDFRTLVPGGLIPLGNYKILTNYGTKPESWHTMIEAFEAKETIDIWAILEKN
jgi:hypothetical protein